jgi:protein dithiol:quinone oxidoreductase
MWENAAMTFSPRLLFAAIVVASVGLVAFAVYYLQGELGLEPCPMCVLSRVTFLSIALACLVAAIHGPRPGSTALKAYGLVIAILAAVGVGISARHSWTQHHPPQFASCGADLEFLLGNLPLAQSLPKIFQGSGSCSVIEWSFLGLTIPEWAGVWFFGIFVVVLWLAFRRKGTSRAG